MTISTAAPPTAATIITHRGIPSSSSPDSGSAEKE